MTSMNGHLFAGTNTGTYRSTDRGESWEQADTGLTNQTVNAMNSSNGVLYAATFGGLFHSSDEGIHWTQFTSGLPSLAFLDIYIRDSSIYCSTYNHSVYLSTNLGISWNNPGTRPLGYTYCSVVKELAGQIFAATQKGLYTLSADRTKWLPVPGGPPQSFCIQMAVLDSVALVTSLEESNQLLYRTTDGGISWDIVDYGETVAQLNAFGSFGTSLFGATKGCTILQSPDGGTSWHSANINALINTISAFSGNDSFLFAGTDAGIFRTSDNGTSWTAMNTGLTQKSVLAIGASDTAVYIGLNPGGIYRSSNNGTSWAPVGVGLAYLTVMSILVTDSALYAATNQQGVYRLRTGETYWLSKNDTMRATALGLGQIGSTILAGVQADGIFRTTDGGEHWLPGQYSSIPVYANSFAVNKRTVFASALKDPVYGADAGVFASGDYGGSWHKIDEGLTDEYVLSILISGDYLYLASNGSGVWRRPLSEITGVKEGTSAIPEKFSIGQNYPNPFNPITEIRYNLPEKSHVILKVYTVLGQEAAVLIDQNQEQGSHTVTWNAAGVASGIYFSRYTVTGEHGKVIYSATRKMLVIK